SWPVGNHKNTSNMDSDTAINIFSNLSSGSLHLLQSYHKVFGCFSNPVLEHPVHSGVQPYL
ncbi:hypothetical protein AMECASPLE_005134, partial [Ameca splendens]